MGPARRASDPSRRTPSLSGPISSFVLIFLGALLCSCPYHLVTERSVELPAGLTSLAVPLAVNRTIEAGLEDVFTQELIKRLRADGRVAIVEPGRGDGELRCEITELAIGAVSYTREGRVAAESAEVSAQCRIVVPGAEGFAWKSGPMTAAEEYPVGDDYLQNEAVKAQALAEAARDLSESVRALLLDSF